MKGSNNCRSAEVVEVAGTVEVMELVAGFQISVAKFWTWGCTLIFVVVAGYRVACVEGAAAQSLHKILNIYIKTNGTGIPLKAPTTILFYFYQGWGCIAVLLGHLPTLDMDISYLYWRLVEFGEDAADARRGRGPPPAPGYRFTSFFLCRARGCFVRTDGGSVPLARAIRTWIVSLRCP